MDGDSRGGAALSVFAVSGRPIKYMGTGEGMDALEPFYPDRIASRILGQPRFAARLGLLLPAHVESCPASFWLGVLAVQAMLLRGHAQSVHPMGAQAVSWGWSKMGPATRACAHQGPPYACLCSDRPARFHVDIQQNAGGSARFLVDLQQNAGGAQWCMT